MSVSLSVLCTRVHGKGIRKSCRNIHVIAYKSGLARCDGNLYKPVTLNLALFAWNSFLFIHSIISIRVTGSKFVPGENGLPDPNLGYPGTRPSPTCMPCVYTCLYARGTQGLVILKYFNYQTTKQDIGQ